jgi:hypothetical protein
MALVVEPSEHSYSVILDEFVSQYDVIGLYVLTTFGREL